MGECNLTGHKHIARGSPPVAVTAQTRWSPGLEAPGHGRARSLAIADFVPDLSD